VLKKDGGLGSTLDILEILLHESRHCETHAHDYDRRFVNRADRDEAIHILRSEGFKSPLESGECIPALGDLSAPPNLVHPPRSLERDLRDDYGFALVDDEKI
jgi:hypothetical protein